MIQVKDTKAKAHYEPVAKGPDYCGICQYFIRPSNGCELVQGFIASRAWCKYFKKAANDNLGKT